MSTRAVIARAVSEGKFAGRYHHSDGYGTGLGDTLIALYRGHFQRDLERMLQYLIDEHPAGWSSIVHKDFTLRPGYTWQQAISDGAKFEVYSKRPDYRRPQCFCHGTRKEEEFLIDQESDTDCEFAYVFGVETRTMHVLDRAKQSQGTGYYWRDIGRIELDCNDPVDWDEIECGKSENWSRCHHVAEYHGINSPLAMQTFIGNRPLDPIHDPLAYRIDGKTFRATGSGGNADWLNRFGKKPFPSGTWVASLIAENNRRLEVPIARQVNGEYKLLDNVSAVYPPTVREHELKAVTRG